MVSVRRTPCRLVRGASASEGPLALARILTLLLLLTKRHDAAASGVVEAGDSSYVSSGTDVYRAADALVLVTPAVGAVTPTNVYGAEVVVVNGVLTSTNDRLLAGGGGTLALPCAGTPCRPRSSSPRS